MSERAIVASILRTLNAIQGCRAVKSHGSVYARRGEPDIRGSIHGRAFFLEVKRPGAKPTPIQESELAAWRRAGAAAEVVHSIAEALAVLPSSCH
jgi:hypothetical protein